MAPDNLASASWGLQLRPAYYSCWTFDGTVEVNWSCEVREGGVRYAEWVPRNGSEIEFFNDILVSGVRALPSPALESIEPFNLRDVQEFKPDFLAGWPTMIYDRSLADASLLAREQVMKKLRSGLSNKIETGGEKRNLHLGGGHWSGMTFKHILLPIYIGTYRFQGKEYQILVNGQTGKVGGQKPRDAIKLFFGGLTVVAFVFLLLMLFWLLSGSKWPF